MIFANLASSIIESEETERRKYMEDEMTLQDREIVDLYSHLSTLERGSEPYMKCITAIKTLEQSMYEANKITDENDLKVKEMELRSRELDIKNRECDLREKEIKVTNRSSWRDFAGNVLKIGAGVAAGVFASIVSVNIKEKELESSEKGFRVENKSKVDIIKNFPKLL